MTANTISLLKDDLKAMIWLFNHGWHTEEQAAAWPVPPGGRQAIGQLSFGAEPGEDKLGRRWPPVCLLEELGHDGEPVSDTSPTAGQDFFDYGSKHCYPSPRTLGRIPAFFRPEFHQTAAFQLKGVWEKSFGDAQGFKNNMGMNLEALLTDRAAAGTHKHQGFKPDLDNLFNDLEDNGGLCSAAGYDQDAFGWLARLMLLHDLHLAPVFAADYRNLATQDPYHLSIGNLSSPVLKAFVANAQAQQKAYGAGTSEQQQTFFFRKAQWIERREALDDLLYQVESIRQRHRNVNNEWYALFGKAYLAHKQAEFRKYSARNRLDLKQNDRHLSWEELEVVAVKIEEKDREKLRRLEEDTSLAKLIKKSLAHPDQPSIDPQWLAAYEKDCRKVLHEIKWMVFPDRLKLHLRYEQLNAAQQEYLKDLGNKIFRIKNRHVGYQAGQIGWDHPNLEFLLRVRDEVRAILEHAGMDVDPGLVIPTDAGITGQNQWLKRELGLIEKEENEIQAELHVLSELEEGEGRIAKRQSEIEDTDRHEAIRDCYLELAKQSNASAQDFEAKLEREFAEEVA